MYKRTMSLVLGLILLLVLLCGIQPVWAKSEEEKLTISILGDSISTFPDYSNGTAANTTNSTITNGATYYPLGNVSAVENTWWYKAAKALNAEILVNNSWSGSCLYQTRSGTVGAYIDRCVQLHDDTGDNAGQEPDIIAVYLGTNDFNTYPSTLGSYAGIDFASLINETDGTVTYGQPKNSMEAYAIVLDKISRRYPNSEVYCFTLLPFPANRTQPTDFNADIKSLAARFGAHIVDLCDCGFSSDTTVFNTLMLNNLHPNDAGMTLMANAFAKAVQENHDHTYQASVTAPTCTEQGYTTHTCKCGHSYVDSYVDAIGHSFTNYISDGNATLGSDGTKTAQCDHGCGQNDTVTDEGSKLPAVITSKKYVVAGTWISKVSVKTTVFEFLANLDQNNVQLTKDGKELSNTSPVGTGTQVQLMFEGKVFKSWTIIVKGDINGDANISITDMVAVKAHILKKETLTDAKAQAADVNGDGTISITDFIQIKSHVLGKQKIAE